MTSRKEPGEGAEWLRIGGPCGDVVLTSRIRLARNFAAFSFPCRASRDERVQILQAARSGLMGGGTPGLEWVDLTTAPELDRSVLVERHLISQQHAKGDLPRAVVVSMPDERLSIMVNEEDHLRMQSIRAGLALTAAFEQLDALDDQIEARADIAFSSRWG